MAGKQRTPLARRGRYAREALAVGERREHERRRRAAVIERVGIAGARARQHGPVQWPARAGARSVCERQPDEVRGGERAQPGLALADLPCRGARRAVVLAAPETLRQRALPLAELPPATARDAPVALELGERLGRIPGVVAVTLGDSRAAGTAPEDGDRDVALYHRGDIRADDVRALGFEGTVGEPGAWGRILDGGARLVIDGRRVDLLYRSLDAVEHWLAEADAGRFEIDRVDGRVAGLPTYALVAELATGELLHGELPRPSFPSAYAAPRRRAGARSPA